MAKTREEKLADIEAKLAEIRAKAAGIKEKVGIAEEMKKAGVEITPTTEISAEELIKGAGPEVPDLGALPPADTKGVDTAFTNAVSTSELLAQQIEQQRKDREALEKSLEERGAVGATTWEKILSYAGMKPKVETAAELAAAQAKYEVPEWLSKVQAQNVKVATIQGDITKMEIQYLNDVERIKDRPAVEAVHTQQVNARTRDYNSKRAYKTAEMSAEAALMQAYQGNLSAARGLVADAVNAYTFDIQQERSDFDNLFNVYGDWINSLEADERNILTQARADLEKQEAQMREDKTNVMNAMLQYPNAGIVLEDTVEEATMKASEYLKTVPEEVPETEYKRLFNEAVTAGYTGTYVDFLRERGVLAEAVRVWSDEELRAETRKMQADELEYQQAIDEITLTPTITNKDRARFIAAEVYGVIEPGTTFEEFMGRKVTVPVKEITAREAEQKAKEAGMEWYIDPETGELKKTGERPSITPPPVTGEVSPLTLPEITTPLFE